MIGTHHRPRRRPRNRHHHPPHHKPVAPPLPGGAPASHESQLAYGSPVSAAGATPNPIPYLLQHARLLELEHQVEDTLKISVTPDAQTASKATSTTPDGALQITGSPGHAHAYWRLRRPVEPDALEQANRTLARHLRGDLASVDAARILRPPGSLSHKHTPPVAVELIRIDHSARHDLEELVEGLAPCPGPPTSHARSRTPRSARTALDQQLLRIPAATYARRLAGLEPQRNGKISCPFHPDRTPSLQLYDDGSFYCYGCDAGGSIYDFAARLWGTQTKGYGFLKLRQRLADVFAITTNAL